MEELKYTKKDIEILKKELENFKGNGSGHDITSQFIEFKANTILRVPHDSELWFKNENINTKLIDRCSHCGRGANQRVMFHMVMGGGSMGSKKDTLLFTLFDGGDMYMYCIGSTCAKNFAKEVMKPLGLDPKDYFYGVDYISKYENHPDYLGIGQEGGA